MFRFYPKGRQGDLNYGLLAVASQRTPYLPLDPTLPPRTLEVACFSALHCMRLKKSNKNLNLQTALLNLQALTNFYQAKCQNSLQAGKG